MKSCPYRREHEFDGEGYCRHCYAKGAPPHTHKWELSFNHSGLLCACTGVIVYEDLQREFPGGFGGQWPAGVDFDAEMTRVWTKAGQPRAGR